MQHKKSIILYFSKKKFFLKQYGNLRKTFFPLILLDYVLMEVVKLLVKKQEKQKAVENLNFLILKMAIDLKNQLF